MPESIVNLVIISMQLILFPFTMILTATVGMVLSQVAEVTMGSLDLGSICNISTSGSLINAAIKVWACFVASTDPLLEKKTF